MNDCVVYIIPDENKISEGVFYMETVMGHLSSLQVFSDRYKLGYHFSQASCYAIIENDNIKDLKVVEGMNTIIHEADKRNLAYRPPASISI